jgi:GNAT superfamily N-acetyltransferase
VSDTAASAVEIKRLDPSCEDDFFRLHSQPPFDWCYCAAWAVPTWDGWGERTAAENRAVREQLFAGARYDGYLLYLAGEPIGWCQCAPLGWFPKLVEQKQRLAADDVFALSCFCLLPAYRKRGLAEQLLAAVLADLAARGVRRVEAYPRHGRHEDGEVWTGPEAIFTRAGFSVVQSDGRLAVMEKTLRPTSSSGSARAC